LLPFVPGVGALLERVGTTVPWYWWFVTYTWLYHLALASILVVLGVVWRLPARACLGRLPKRSEVVDGLQLTAFVFLVSLVAAYLVFYPISLVAPEVVQRWYIESSQLIYFDFDRGSYPVLPNLLEVLSLCVAAPVLEEITFRGIILPRWSKKWGIAAGMIASSTVFALPHIDPVGAFVFGLAMCVLYLKTQSLMLPILCHATHNFVVWFIEAVYAVSNGPEHFYTLEEFRAGWPWAAGAAMIAAVWMLYYLRRPKNDVPWSLPVS
jgi:membrane protease YdiL (CAAX protease family)